MKFTKKFLLIAGVAMLLSACSSNPPMKTVDYVDIDRFMGKWYVIANIPTFLEKEAFNAVEEYQRDPDGTIATTFSFRDGSFNGDLKTYNPRGFIKNTETNALWGMRFIWPFKADYRVVYLDETYNKTIIGRQARDYVWLMARTPSISDSDYEELARFIAELGYDSSLLQRVPQSWPAGES